MAGEQAPMPMGTATVLRVFLDDTRQPRYGYDLMRRTGYSSGRVYRILAHLEAAGWLDKQWDTGSPPRRWYWLSGKGAEAARYQLAARYRWVGSKKRLWRRLVQP